MKGMTFMKKVLAFMMSLAVLCSAAVSASAQVNDWVLLNIVTDLGEDSQAQEGEEAEVEEPEEPKDDDEEEVSVDDSADSDTDVSVDETNPATGAALAITPVVLAAVTAVLSKKK